MKKKGDVTKVDKKLQTIAIDILDRISGGADEKSVCDHFRIQRGTFIKWMITYPQFESAVIEARKQRADSFRSIIQTRMYDEDGKFKVIEKDAVPGEKLIFEQLKWLAEIDNPEKYGTKVKHEGGNIMPVQIVVDTGIKPVVKEEKVKETTIETTSEEVKEDFNDMEF